jgi:L-seryl-tRNA(Ser) seleniumtransferase
MTRDIYRELGVRTVINAAGTYTMVGGSRMSEATLEAMASAARSHVVIKELQEKVHGRLASLTRNEAAFVTNGAAAALHVAGAAAIAQKKGRPFQTLSREQIEKSEIIVHRAHRNPYDWSLRLLNCSLVEIGYPNMILPTVKEDLEYAITENTAAVFYFFMPPGGWTARGALSLEETIEVASRRGVPVIVDAAAQVPPAENLWKLTGLGAEACIFSGGKDLRGPQASGLMVGRKEFFSWVERTAFPTYGVGRMFKVGREEIVGLLAAVEQYVSSDGEERVRWAEERIAGAVRAFSDNPVVKAERVFPNEAGQPFPQMVFRFNRPGCAGEVLKLLMEGEPAVFTMAADGESVFANPMTLRDGEIDAIMSRIREIGALFAGREGK